MADGWIKAHRQLLEWEWYQHADTVRLFFHCLLKANHESAKWRGHTIERGSFISSSLMLSKELQISRQKIRSSLNRLKSTNELTTKSTNRFTAITVCNYEIYQSSESEINQPVNQQLTSNQPTVNQQLTTNKNDKNEKNQDNINIAPVQMCADANDTIKPTAGKCILLFMETYQKIKSFNPRAEFKNIQHALFEAVAMSGEDKIMQSLDDYVYYANRCNQREYCKSPVKWLEDCQFKTDWLQMVDASNKGKNNSQDWEVFNARDAKYPEMIWEN